MVATAGLATAQDRPAAAPSPAPQAQSSVPPRQSHLRQFRKGTLVGFDVEKATVTFKDDSGKTLTWQVEVRLAEQARAYAEMRLATLKAGDRVRVSYFVNAEGEPRVYDVRPFIRPERQTAPAGDAPPAAPTESPAAPPR